MVPLAATRTRSSAPLLQPKTASSAKKRSHRTIATKSERFWVFTWDEEGGCIRTSLVPLERGTAQSVAVVTATASQGFPSGQSSHSHRPKLKPGENTRPHQPRGGSHTQGGRAVASAPSQPARPRRASHGNPTVGDVALTLKIVASEA
jgi:hypothetical protein